MNFFCAHGKSHGHGQNIMGVPVTVAMGNSYYVFFCAHGNSHGHAHAYNHGHAHDYVHGHVYYWQTCALDLQTPCLIRILFLSLFGRDPIWVVMVSDILGEHWI